MTTITQGFTIEDEHIKWGSLFRDAKEILSKFPHYPSYGGWSNVRCTCSEVYGLKSTVANIRAPLDQRPVMQVSYELAPTGDTTWRKLHESYVTQLIHVFGQPTKTESLYSDRDYNKKYISGSVVYSAKWLVGDVRISLSVYGGTRHEQSGDSAAGLYIDWVNEKKAAEPFRNKNIALEQEIYARLLNSKDIEKHTLTDNQRKFYVPRIDIGDPDVTKDENVRLAQMALYRNELLQTPDFLQHSLKENEIVIKFFKEEHKMIITNKWDATFLKYSEGETIGFIDMLPARGPGGYLLQVKDLSIVDTRQTNTLINIAAHIESTTGVQVKRETSYDD